MSDLKNKFNKHFTDEENARLAQLIKYEPETDKVYIKKVIKRKRKVDKHLPLILEKKSIGWSLDRIAKHLMDKKLVSTVNKSTVWHRINLFYTVE